MKLRPLWHRKLKEAYAILKNLSTPVAKQTWEVISSGKVTIKNVSQMILKDYVRAACQLDTQSWRIEERTPLSNRFQQAISWEARIFHNRIYMKATLETEEIVRYIAHEVNHYLNVTGEHILVNHYKTPEDILREELRAHIAEEAVFRQRRLTLQFLQLKTSHIIEDYHLQGVCLTEALQAEMCNTFRV